MGQSYEPFRSKAAAGIPVETRREKILYKYKTCSICEEVTATCRQQVPSVIDFVDTEWTRPWNRSGGGAGGQHSASWRLPSFPPNLELDPIALDLLQRSSPLNLDQSMEADCSVSIKEIPSYLALSCK